MFWVFSALLLTANVSAADKLKDFILCRNNKTVRTIRVDKATDTTDWITYYTKGGVDKEVGRGKSLDSNKKISDNIRKNLELAGWRCKNVSDSSVSEASR